jgi:hypothetical protein
MRPIFGGPQSYWLHMHRRRHGMPLLWHMQISEAKLIVHCPETENLICLALGSGRCSIEQLLCLAGWLCADKS